MTDYSYLTRHLSTGQLAVTTDPQLVAAVNPDRAGLLLKGLGPAAVYVGTSPNLTTASGFPLATGEYIELDSPDPIYVVAAATGSTLAWAEVC